MSHDVLPQPSAESDRSGAPHINTAQLTEELRAISEKIAAESLGSDSEEDRRERAELTAEAYRELTEDTPEKQLLGNAGSIAGEIADPYRRNSVRVQLVEAYGSLQLMAEARAEIAKITTTLPRVEAWARLAAASGFETVIPDLDAELEKLRSVSGRAEGWAIRGEFLRDQASYGKAISAASRSSEVYLSPSEQEAWSAERAAALAKIAQHGYAPALDLARRQLEKAPAMKAPGALYEIARASHDPKDVVQVQRALATVRAMGPDSRIGPSLPAQVKGADPWGENFMKFPVEVDAERANELVGLVGREGPDALARFLENAHAKAHPQLRDGLLATYALASVELAKTGSTTPGSSPRGGTESPNL